jgi:hypothetical protein
VNIGGALDIASRMIWFTNFTQGFGIVGVQLMAVSVS